MVDAKKGAELFNLNGEQKCSVICQCAVGAVKSCLDQFSHDAKHDWPPLCKLPLRESGRAHLQQRHGQKLADMDKVAVCRSQQPSHESGS